MAPSETELQHKENLNRFHREIENNKRNDLAYTKNQASLGRKRLNPANKIKSATQVLSPLKYIEILDWLWVGIAITVALLKDILDFTPLGLPGISFVLTFIASLTIGACMFQIGASATRAAVKKSANGFLFKKIGTLIIGSLTEIIFGLGFIPIETVMTIYIYWLTLKERQTNAQPTTK